MMSILRPLGVGRLRLKRTTCTRTDMLQLHLIVVIFRVLQEL